MDQKQHPDSIWTWKSARNRRRASLWVPYLSSITKIKAKGWQLEYRGGTLDVYPDQVDTIMFYGASGELPLAFIDDMAQQKVVLLIHRRNIATPVCFFVGQRSDEVDILSAQIKCRENKTRQCYLARTFIAARFRSVENILPVPAHHFRQLARLRDIDEIRSWEATHSRLYWDRYFEGLGYPDTNRRTKNPLSAALDAGSMFLAGILLRWILVHKLSPMHGYLHIRTEYTALVYDLMEPSRYMIEMALERAIHKWDGKAGDALTAFTLSALKQILDETVYVSATRQFVRRKNLLHGAVLSLRAYLIGDMRRFVLPVEDKPKGGRPVKVSFKMPGGRKQKF